jgi:hypothetical protein
MMEINISKKEPNFHSATCWVLMDGWKLLMLACHYGYSCSGVAQ